ncbi:capsular biosynthesis protein [Vibrio splendidus]|uniref:capsular biosynthesis protein n=1 Tax=Vibrio splendidus TaxID=29497 RepID=UPI000C821D88|nr:capsular biosynthesis protein [Vibrio splendidus]PMI50801.1 capsular biosynthesis protein [Vibrio splendidus]
MFLIMSAAYVDAELQSEFGRIPPSFLPLGNRRLFQHQVSLKPEEDIAYLSVPESYVISKTDVEWLQKNDVVIVPTPDNLTLGESLVATLNLIQSDLASPLSVLYGDTLFSALSKEADIVSVSAVKSSYNWAVATNDTMHWLKNCELDIDATAKNIVSGFFNFSNPREIIRCITQSRWDFLEGLNRYHQSIGLKTVYSEEWLDFGHVNTYYRSKANYTTQRSFNNLEITFEHVEKSSSKTEKIMGEAKWFETLPFSLRNYIPQYLGANNTPLKTSYKLEYLHNTALNELYVFSKLPANVWELILDDCIDFLKRCKGEQAIGSAPKNDLKSLFFKKTYERVSSFCSARNMNLDENWTFNNVLTINIRTMVQESITKLKGLVSDSAAPSVVHGDFCFSNILYDFRANRIKVIDPRGINSDGEHTIYGDIRYDIAKLSHSILGMYDWILAGCYNVNVVERKINFHIEEATSHIDIQKSFLRKIELEFGLSAEELMAMQVLLFLSMLPLHDDDKNRQDALFANAFRIYKLMKEL